MRALFQAEGQYGFGKSLNLVQKSEQELQWSPVDPLAQECCRSWKNIVDVILCTHNFDES